MTGYERSLIEAAILEKKTEKTGVVQAIFPELPFKEESFDNFVAAFSISYETFKELDAMGYEICWKEVFRVLRKGGQAIIFPIDSVLSEDKLTELLASLNIFCSSNNGSYELLNNKGMATEDIQKAKSLVIRKL